MLQAHYTGTSPKDVAPPPPASSTPCHLMTTTPDDYLGYQGWGSSPWDSSVGASGQSPTYLAIAHKNKVNERNGKKKRMKTSMGGVCGGWVELTGSVITITISD